MSDNLPFQLQVEIIKRLPVRPLLQFRSVSKRWKTLIDSSKFIAAHTVGQTQLNRLLVWYEDCYVDLWETGEKIVSFVDDETLKSISIGQEIDPTTLGLSKQYKDLRVVGSSQGLLCLYDSVRDRSCYKSGTSMVVLWNPSIRKSVGIVVPRVLGWGFQHTVFGFGVCPITSDPMIVKITNLGEEMKHMASVPWLVEVFTLSAGSWRIPTTKLPDKPVTVTWKKVAIGKFIYWFAYYGIEKFGVNGSDANKLIVSFDMTTQEISLIDLPNCFAHQSSTEFSISKFKGSLVLLQYSTNNEKQDCVIWMMNTGIPNLFTKLFTINAPYATINILGFMKNGGAMMEMQDEFGDPAPFAFYDLCSKDLNATAFEAKYGSFFVDSYMETLLLLNHPDSSVFSIINTEDKRMAALKIWSK